MKIAVACCLIVMPIVAGPLPADDAQSELRRAVIDALASHEAAVSTGRWIGEVQLSIGCVGSKPAEEGGGTLELLWQGDSTWGKYHFETLDRVRQVTAPLKLDREFFEHQGDRAVYCVRSQAVWSFPQASSFRYDQRARVRPDQAWFLFDRQYPWRRVLEVPTTYPMLTVTHAETTRMGKGIIRLTHELQTGMRYSIDVDEQQGLNVVRWNASWTDWRDEGSAKWQQTADGIWYPEFIEHSAIRPPCFRVPSKFKLATTSFDPHPNFSAKQFEWRQSVPSGTKFEINDKSGKTIRRGMIGRREAEKPEEELNRLGDDAWEGFPSPNKK